MRWAFFAVIGFSMVLPPKVRGIEQRRSPAGRNQPWAMLAGASARDNSRASIRGPASEPVNRWRYSFHNGHWWYYRDGGRWAYWTGSQWRDYEPTTYRRWYVGKRMSEYDATLAQFNAHTMLPYMADRFQDSASAAGQPVLPRQGTYGLPTVPQSNGAGPSLFYPRPFDGRLNPATSTGGYMGGALRGPFGD
ncbi:MAG TPA: hypothetical protein VHC22_02785 [Pirellulales bacterium]|nr:hypothetical protein [Pirellulales bacterium]